LQNRKAWSRFAFGTGCRQRFWHGLQRQHHGCPLISDIRMARHSVWNAWRVFVSNFRNCLVIIMTRAILTSTARWPSYQGGAFGILPSPFDVDEGRLALVRRGAGAQPRTGWQEPDDLRRLRTPPPPPPPLAGNSSAKHGRCRKSFRAIGRLSHPTFHRIDQRLNRVPARNSLAHALHRPARARGQSLICTETWRRFPRIDGRIYSVRERRLYRRCRAAGRDASSRPTGGTLS